jgi:hypothetical protein
MSKLYEDIIKKKYSMNDYKSFELSASDYVTLLCSTSNINEDVKLILKQSLDKLHSKRNEYIEYSIYKNYYNHIVKSIEEYVIGHFINKNEIPKIIQYIWNKLPQKIKNEWSNDYMLNDSFRVILYNNYPYLLYLYGLTSNEIDMMHINNNCSLIRNISVECLLNEGRCVSCETDLKSETNMNNILNKLFKNIKNEYDFNFITRILIDTSSARYIFLLNNELCNKYMYLSVNITNKNIEDDVIRMRVKIREYYKLHDLIRKKITRRNNLIKMNRKFYLKKN